MRMFTVELVLYCSELRIISRREPLPRSIQYFENSKAYLTLKRVVAFEFLDGKNTIRKTEGAGIIDDLSFVWRYCDYSSNGAWSHLLSLDHGSRAILGFIPRPPKSCRLGHGTTWFCVNGSNND